MLMLSYVIIISCIDVHVCMDGERVFLHPMHEVVVTRSYICLLIAA